MKLESLSQLQEVFDIHSPQVVVHCGKDDDSTPAATTTDPLALLATKAGKYHEMTPESKAVILNFLVDVCSKTANILTGGDEAAARTILTDLRCSMSNKSIESTTTTAATGTLKKEPLVEPDYDEYDVKLNVVDDDGDEEDAGVSTEANGGASNTTQSLEDVILRAMLCASKATAEYRTLRSVLCQVYSKKEINEMLKKWKVVEDISELENLQELEKRGSKRLRINVEEFRTALQDYSILTASHNVSEHESTGPPSRKRRKENDMMMMDNNAMSSSGGGNSSAKKGGATSTTRTNRRGIAPKFKNMLLAEFIRRLGNFTISEAVHWLKQCSNEAEPDFPTDKQIRGYISILRMNNKKTGEIPQMVEE